MHEVGALTGALADTGEHRHTTVVLRHTADHLGDEHGLADAGTTEQADLATGDVRGEQVDDLDAGLEQALRRLEGVEVGGRTVDVPALDVGEVGVVAVEHLAPHVPHVAEGAVADGHADAAAGVAHRGATGEAVGRLQADGAHAAVAELLGDLGEHGDRLAVDLHGELERMVELGQRAAGELDVDHGAGDADHAPVLAVRFRHGHGSVFLVLVALGNSVAVLAGLQLAGLFDPVLSLDATGEVDLVADAGRILRGPGRDLGEGGDALLAQVGADDRADADDLFDVVRLEHPDDVAVVPVAAGELIVRAAPASAPNERRSRPLSKPSSDSGPRAIVCCFLASPPSASAPLTISMISVVIES